jgi:hypothetical protein
MTAVHAEHGIPAAAALARDCADGLADLARTADLDTGPAGFLDGAAGIRWALGQPTPEPAPAPDLGWGAGAAGLAIAGGDVDPLLRDRPVLADLSLCHGELGIAEALTVLAGRDDRVAATRRRRAGLILDAYGRYGAVCGTPGGVTSPGLLTGLAGIGYGLLRLGFADRVPSALLLQPAHPH